MKRATLVRESLNAAWASRIPTILVMVVVAAMTFAALLTVGRQAAQEALLTEQLAGPDARTLTITSARSPGQIPYAVVPLLQGLQHAESVLATDLPRDAYNGALPAGGGTIAVTTAFGDLADAITITTGRLPGPGEVVVPVSRLGALNLDLPAGYLRTAAGQQWSIVGAFEAQPPYEHLNSLALTAPDPAFAALDGASLNQVKILAESTEQVRAVQAATLAIIDADPRAIQVGSAAAAADVSQAVAGQFAGFGRSLLLLILGAGAFFVGVVVLADVLVRRRDLGRRRTLGITRSDLVTLVAIRTTVPAGMGALLGTALVQVMLAVQSEPVPWDFAVAVAVLASLTALVASLAPAIFASRRDPVAVMRTA